MGISAARGFPLCEEVCRTEGPPHGDSRRCGGFFAAQGFPLCECFPPRRGFRSTGFPPLRGILPARGFGVKQRSAAPSRDARRGEGLFLFPYYIFPAPFCQDLLFADGWDIIAA